MKRSIMLCNELRLVHRGAQPEAQAQQAAAGRKAAAGEQLVQIDLADAGLLGQLRLGHALFVKNALDGLLQRDVTKAGVVFRQETIQIVGAHQFLLEGICVFLVHSVITPLQQYAISCNIIVNF